MKAMRKIVVMTWIAFVGVLAGCGGGDGGGDDCAGGVVPDQGCSCGYPKKNPGSLVCTRDVALGTAEVKRTQCSDIREFCARDGVIPPKLGCLTAGPANEPAAPATVTLTGWVDVFSSGPSSNDVTVEVYDAAQLDAAATIDSVTPLGKVTVLLNDASFAAQARFCPEPTSELGRMDATCRPQTADCAGCAEASLVTGSKYCLNTTCQERLRTEVRYEIPNIPTKKFLAIRTRGPGGVSDPLWGPLVQYNVYVSTAARACTKPEGTDPEDTECLRSAGAGSARYEKNVNVLSKSDYMTIPVTLGTSITPGFGAVAGEVRDCDDVRVEGAQVSFDVIPGVRSYSNANPNKTVFDLGLESAGTSRLGIFTGINMAPGVVNVEAWGKVAGAATLIGKYRAKVWPDTVSTITINGGRPPQP